MLRTRKVGHHFTQGTADSNEVWVEVTARAGAQVIGRSGGSGPTDASIRGRTSSTSTCSTARAAIDRRNVQDIYVPLYDKQIPPGAAQVVHYALEVPRDARGPITLEARLQYRKFDPTMMKLAMGDAYRIDLPVTTIASGAQTLPSPAGAAAPAQPAWERWNDYGIGLLLEGNAGSEKGELRQAEAAFAEVERLGRPEGPLNLARVYHKEGRLEDAVARAGAGARGRRRAVDGGVAHRPGQQGERPSRRRHRQLRGGARRHVAGAAGARLRLQPRLRGAERARPGAVRARQAGARRDRGPRPATALLRRAVDAFDRTLAIDAENVTAHYALSLLHGELGDQARAAAHREAHLRYTPDEQSRSRVIAMHRLANPAANHAAQALVIYDLQRRPETAPATAPQQ